MWKGIIGLLGLIGGVYVGLPPRARPLQQGACFPWTGVRGPFRLEAGGRAQGLDD